MSLWGPVLTLTARREAPSLMGRVGQVGRSSKVSFNVLHTLCVYRTCIDNIYIYSGFISLGADISGENSPKS